MGLYCIILNVYIDWSFIVYCSVKFEKIYGILLLNINYLNRDEYKYNFLKNDWLNYGYGEEYKDK